MAATNGWTYSKSQGDYYRAVTRPDGLTEYEFYSQAKQQAPSTAPTQYAPTQQYPPQLPGYQPPSQSSFPFTDAGHSNNIPYDGQWPYQQPPRPDSSYGGRPDTNNWINPPLNANIPGIIHGTAGFRERLDPSYTQRMDASNFFTKGRVFAILHTEAASEDALKHQAPYPDSITVVKFGQHVFSQIRRFIVVVERQGFCYACPISTYSNRGTLKEGCNPAEHAIVYVRGTVPMKFDGENGMTIEPIAIDPAEPGIILTPASRVRLGKFYPIEWNVKVKHIGKVINEDMQKLVRGFKERNPDMLVEESR